jgi:hypothetical protein
MKKEVMALANFEILPAIALFCFLAVFVGMLFWIYRKGSDEVHKEICESVLNDGDKK